jgi:PAS domain S-box-containing protein
VLEDARGQLGDRACGGNLLAISSKAGAHKAGVRAPSPSPDTASSPAPQPAPLSFLAGGGEAGARIRALDWTRTPLGDPSGWPQSLRTVVRVMLDSRYAMWMLWGPELTFLCNDAYLPTVGIKRDWVLGARSDLVWEEIWPDIGPRIQQVLTRGEATWDEALQLFLERSGFPEETYHTFSYSPVYDDASRIAGMLCVVTEVTERVIGERQLRVLRDLATQSVTERSVDETCARICEVLGRYPLDVSFGGLYLVNGSTARRVAQVRDLPATVLPDAFDLDSVPVAWPLAALLATLETQEVADLPERGTVVAAAPWSDPVRRALMIPLKSAGSDRLTGFLIAGVSPRRPLDASYRRFLELVATQAAAAITDAQAYRAERLRAEALAELDQAKTVFFSNVSHEFRTPLTLMLGPLEQALAAPADALPAHREELEVAHRNALRLLKLVNTLLDFSRLEAGRIRASFAPVDLAALTLDLASTFRSAIEQAGLRLEVRCDHLPTQAWVDPDLWEKIVLNLLSNAFKYTLRGTIGVSLTGTAERIELAVSDTGIGIPPEAQPHLFERFYRVPHAQGRTHEGTGIGLSLVSELVKQHGGEIRVESTPGAGSRFIVTLPAGDAHLPRERLSPGQRDPRTTSAAAAFVEEATRWHTPEVLDSGPAPAPEPDARAGARPVVLLADDNADMRRYIERLLMPQFRVIAVADGEQALAALGRERPDLVLSDIMMPHLDGLGLLSRIRRDARWRDLPVILLSARAGEEARIAGLDAEADDYVVKPFAARELIARVANQIAISRARREAHATVTASEQRFRTALSASHVGFTVLQAVRDAAGTIEDFEWRYVNSAAERLLGQPARELLGRRVASVLPGHWDTPHLLARLSAVVETGEPADMEFTLHPHQRTHWYHNSVAKMDDGVVVWFADITERKRVESELREVDRRKDEFLATLAHELRNPLAPIRQAAAIASAPRVSATQLRWSHGVIERQARHMARLLDDLLDVSRITRGTLELRREWLDVGAVVDAAVETSTPALDARGHAFTVSVAEGLPQIHADGLRLAQVLSNLLNNAAKYTDAGGQVTLTARREGDEVSIRVSDTGIGIEPEALPRMFQMFSQLRPALERSEGGLGIGLALVKGLVALHGGSVEVRSGGVGQGCEFELRLPLTGPRHKDSHDAAAQATGTAPGQALRMLVVDDNADAAESLAMLLALDGHEVKIAFDAEQALALAIDFRPQLAILDIGLPGRNGYEVALDLRRLAKSRPPKLIALTGWGAAEDRARAHNAGFDHHLTKPVDPDALRALVRTLSAHGVPPD